MVVDCLVCVNCFWGTNAESDEWLNKPQLLQVLLLAMHLSQCPGSHGDPQLEQGRGGGRLHCLWKLFLRDKCCECWEGIELHWGWPKWGSYCRPVIEAHFEYRGSMLIASSRALLGSTVCFKSSFCVSESIWLLIKIYLISVSSLFWKSAGFF